MVLTDRDAAVVHDVADFQLLTRQHLIRLGHFRSKTRANATLLRLIRFGYLSRRHQPSVAGTQRALYFVGPQAEALLNSTASVRGERRRIKQLSDLFIAHQLLVTEVRLAFRRSEDGYRWVTWHAECDLRPLALGLIADGHVEYESQGRRFGAFIEVDRGTETLTRWRAKVDTYLTLASSGRYRSHFERPYFRVLVVTPSPVRLEHLRRVTATRTDKIFWFTTSDRLAEGGPLTPIWWRPVDAHLHALTES
jgi:hypothetical protein